MAATVDIRLLRADRIYRPKDKVRGVIVVCSPDGPLDHSGINLVMEGTVSLQLSAKSVGLFEAFYSSVKPIQLLRYDINFPPSQIPKGTVEMPFEFDLKPLQSGDGAHKIYETYHGVFVNVQYTLCVDVSRRSMLSANLNKTMEFIVEVPTHTEVEIKETPVPFRITRDSLENVKKGHLSDIPMFQVTGRMNSVHCSMDRPFSGEVIIEQSDAAVRSIELQLVRLETCGYSEGVSREATEIQNIQLADGDVVRGWPIPIHMIMPRLFTCPTTSTRHFKIEFEVNLVVLLSDGHLITENFPIKIYREINKPCALIM